MARYTDSKCRICRREGTKIFLKGDRCFTDKCPYERRPYPPGQHGRKRKKSSDYELQLREKQKVRRMYGILERQFHHYFLIAERQKGVTGTNLLRLLEMRLDNVVYKMGFANSRDQARQLVRHGHVRVNGQKTDLPSVQLNAEDEVVVSEKGKKIPFVQEATEVIDRRGIPGWIEVDGQEYKGRVKQKPEREDITFPINEHLIVELYSK
ncbi:MAG: 30S ribosomal protein S4 [Desulfohalobiaceae bacterium]|nr:30S ribosomal protein S4 [Desulfohalobiaceae bacterium]